MQVGEISGEFRDVMVITELRGQYPSVPTSGDVDYEGLIAGDAAPLFITIPIGKAGVTSGNKRHYDDAFVMELMKQTLANKPIGLMGHLSDTDRATEFPPEAVHWVGAVRDGDLIWGKAYVVPGAVRDRIQRYKAHGKALATSIDAFAEGIWDEQLKAHRMSAKSLRLNQIDIVPADRAGIPDLAAVPLLTTEMDAPEMDIFDALPAEASNSTSRIGGQTSKQQEATMPEKIDTAALRAIKVPPNRGWQPSSAQPPTQETALREMLGADENADLVQLVQELRQQTETLTLAAIKNRIKELVEGGIKLESARAIVTEMIELREPQSVEEAEAIYRAVTEKQSVKEMLSLEVRSASGPAAIVNGKVAAGGRPKLADTPEARQAARAEMGL